jgi:hypothetical protein
MLENAPLPEPQSEAQGFVYVILATLIGVFGVPALVFAVTWIVEKRFFAPSFGLWKVERPAAGQCAVCAQKGRTSRQTWVEGAGYIHICDHCVRSFIVSGRFGSALLALIVAGGAFLVGMNFLAPDLGTVRLDSEYVRVYPLVRWITEIPFCAPGIFLVFLLIGLGFLSFKLFSLWTERTDEQKIDQARKRMALIHAQACGRK